MQMDEDDADEAVAEAVADNDNVGATEAVAEVIPEVEVIEPSSKNKRTAQSAPGTETDEAETPSKRQKSKTKRSKQKKNKKSSHMDHVGKRVAKTFEIPPADDANGLEGATAQTFFGTIDKYVKPTKYDPTPLWHVRYDDDDEEEYDENDVKIGLELYERTKAQDKNPVS